MAETAQTMQRSPGRCVVTWPAELQVMGNSSHVQVHLYARGVSTVSELIGSWEFGPVSNPVTALKLDLWRFDYYSMKLIARSGEHLATSHWATKTPSVTNRLRMDIAALAPGGFDRKFSAMELLLTDSEVSATNRRFALDQVPPIEWFFMELTNHCNYACTWCPNRKSMRRRGFMPLENAKRLIKEIADYKKRNPLFSFYAKIKNPVFLHVMGEPLLHRNLFEIIEYGHDLGVDFCLITNISRLNHGNIKRLLDVELSSLVLSLNAPDARSYGKCAAPVTYGEIISNIEELIRERHKRQLAVPRIEIQLLDSTGFAANRWSLIEDESQVSDQLGFWSELVRDQEREAGTSRFSSELFHPGRWRHILEKQENSAEAHFEIGRNLFLVFKKACNFAGALMPQGVGARETHIGSCPLRNAHRVFCVLWDGSCTFCSLDYDNEVKLGNVFEHGIEATWGGERMRRIRGLMDHGILSEPLCRRCLGNQPAS